jgi:hypothetical protein
MQNTLQEIEKVNNKNRNQNFSPIKSEHVKAVLLKTHFLRYYIANILKHDNTTTCIHRTKLIYYNHTNDEGTSLKIWSQM